MSTGLFDVAGKVALVTGGTSGIGLMIARGLVRAGVTTHIVGRDLARCTAVAAQLSAEGGSCNALAGDMARLADVRALAEQLATQTPRLDILVNNAGALHDAPIDEFSEEGWDSVVDLNLRAPFFLAQQTLPLLRAAASADNPARIINIGSIGGLRPSGRENYSYVASKAGLHTMTQALARRLGREHITANAIAPGPFPSRLTENAPEAAKTAVRQMIPRGRFGDEDDIAGAVLFLASRAGSYVTGVVLPVDGGLTLAS